MWGTSNRKQADVCFPLDNFHCCSWRSNSELDGTLVWPIMCSQSLLSCEGFFFLIENGKFMLLLKTASWSSYPNIAKVKQFLVTETTISHSPTGTMFWCARTVRKTRQQKMWSKVEKQVMCRNRRRMGESWSRRMLKQINTRNYFQKAEI